MTTVLLVVAAHPLWSQSAVWQPQGATTGNIYYNGGNVGIGTASPVDKLDVNGNLGIGRGAVGVNVINKSFATLPHNPANVPSSLGLVLEDGWVSGVFIKSFRDGSYNSQAIEFVTHHGGISAGTRMTIAKDGNVGIGTTNPQYKLAVEGAIGARDIIVTNTPWSDYVFQPGYRLRPLSEVASFIRQHGHLPEIPSEAEVKEKGVSVAEVQAKLLAKVEELTLHLIQQEKEHRDLRENLTRDNRELRDRLTRLETQAGSGNAPAFSR